MKKIAGPLGMTLMMFALFIGCTKKEIETIKPVVDAGVNVSMKVTADSVLLTATVSEGEAEISEYLWRKVSGAGTPEILTPNSKSTWVKNLSTGSYLFQIMVKNEKGDIGTDTVAVEVIAADTTTFVAAPSHNINEVHLFGNESGFDQTDTIAPELLGGYGTYNGDPTGIRALLKFDMMTIPSTAKIVSAKLTLFSNPTPLNGIDGNPNYGTDNALLVQRVTESWMYNTVDWLSQPSATEIDQIEIEHTAEPSLDIVDLDVTNLVSTMHAEGNYGFLIRLKTEAIYNFRIFCSSKYTDASKHPKLDIVYID